MIFGAAAPLGLLAPALRRAGARQIVGLTHGHETWWARVPAARQLLRRIGESCDHLTTISGFTERLIASALSPSARGRLLRLAPPVDPGRFRPPEAAAARSAGRCIAVARLIRRKGMATLLRAWRAVIDRAAPSGATRELVLVGDGPQRPRLERSIHELELSDHVRLIGALPAQQCIGQLQQAYVFALPVRTRLAGLNPEGLGLAALEAAACGLPVIVGHSGGAPETVRDGDTGFVVPSHDHQLLAERLSLLLDNPSLAQQMGSRGRHYVSAHFSLDSARATLREALGSLMQRAEGALRQAHAYAMARGGSDQRQHRYRGKARRNHGGHRRFRALPRLGRLDEERRGAELCCAARPRRSAWCSTTRW